MTLYNFAQLVRAREAELAPGNETPLLTHLHTDLEDYVGSSWGRIYNGDDVPASQLNYVTVPAWWMKAYDLWAIDLKRAPEDRYEDIQDLFDAVDATGQKRDITGFTS